MYVLVHVRFLHLYLRVKLELGRLAKEREAVPETTAVAVTCYSARALRHTAVLQSRCMDMTVILDPGTLWGPGGVHILFYVS